MGAHIGGQVVCVGERFKNLKGAALIADVMTVDLGLALLKTRFRGEVRLGALTSADS
jgi:hypothetical protein